MSANMYQHPIARRIRRFYRESRVGPSRSCGIRYADFGRSPWQADQVQPNYHPRFVDRGPEYVRGTMTLTTPTEARFDSPTEDLRLTFHPLTGKLEGCD
ncbi:hypothetical protein AB0J72_43400 [Dactylosporangium sp. NPDC049742]|uniref:hypothetical protein n=1 Tax=Dactylosporangium sp. NPDC049742 TaxID=3154737 RepID=UPI0034470247